MLATRGNNENAIYEQQTATAKSLNQGNKGLASKTPANNAPKTPSKGQKNDENATFAIGKTGAKEGKANRNAFVTPANPRTRAPLGNKTTNAKALLQASVPPATQAKPSSTKPTSPRLRRSKIKVHEASAEPTEDVLQAEQELEIEYMAPRGEPLPDFPDDIWPHDREYSQLQGSNLTRGWLSEYMSEPEENDDLDLDTKWKKAEQERARLEEIRKRMATATGKNKDADITRTAAPTTLKAHDAATALAKKPVKSTAPSFAAPTAAARARHPMAIAAKPPTSTTSGNLRFTAAKVASKSTIGYSKGRQVSASARRPLADLHGREAEAPVVASDKKTSLAELLGMSYLYAGDDERDVAPLFAEPQVEDDENADDEEVFQLPLGDL